MCGQHSSSSSSSCSLPHCPPPSSQRLRYRSGVSWLLLASPLVSLLSRSRTQLSPSFISRPTTTRALRLLRQGHIGNTKDSSVKPPLYGPYVFLNSQSSTNPYLMLTKDTVMTSLIMLEALIIPINFQAVLMYLIWCNQARPCLIVAINTVLNGYK